jgi:hypothetical protein
MTGGLLIDIDELLRTINYFLAQFAPVCASGTSLCVLPGIVFTEHRP